MHLELVEHLRCPNAHDETWLVASTSTVRNRHIVDGLLGCPICRARYPVQDGVVIFGERDNSDAHSGEAATDDERVIRLAALLNLDDGTGVVLLGREQWFLARALHEATAVAVFQLDPPVNARMGDGISGLAGAATLPVAANVLRGAALDARAKDDVFVGSVIRALRPKGRLIAPAATPLHAELKELARDDHEWVAETQGPGAPIIPLRRA